MTDPTQQTASFPEYDYAIKQLNKDQNAPAATTPPPPQSLADQQATEQKKQQRHKDKKEVAQDAAQEEGEAQKPEFGDYFEDAVEGVGAGAEGFVRSLGKLANDVGGAFGHSFTDDPHAFDNKFFKTHTWAGAVTSGITQFALGFLPALGIAGKIGGALGLAGKLATTGESLAAGAASDFFGFRDDQQRLSNLIQDIPAIKNPVTEFLSSKPEDTWAEGRLKNALEGLGLGVVSDMAFAALKGFKAKVSAVKAGDAAAYAKAADETADAVAKVTPKDVVPTTGSPVRSSISIARDLIKGDYGAAKAPKFKGGEAPNFTAATITPEEFTKKFTQRIKDLGLSEDDARYADVLDTKPTTTVGELLKGNPALDRLDPAVHDVPVGFAKLPPPDHGVHIAPDNAAEKQLYGPLGKILVHSGVPEDAVKGVVAHEASHAQDFLKGTADSADVPYHLRADEARADQMGDLAHGGTGWSRDHNPVDPIQAADDVAKTHLNLDRLDITQDGKQMMDWLNKVGDSLNQSSIGGVRKLQQAQQLAAQWFDEIGVGTKFQAWLSKDSQAIEGMWGRMISYRMGRNSILEQMKNLSLQITGLATDGPEKSELFKQLDGWTKQFTQVHQMVQKIQTEGARIPSFQRVIAGFGQIDWDGMAGKVSDVVLGHEGKEAQTKLVKALTAASGDTKGALNLFRGIQAAGGKFLSVHNEAWINALLSGNAFPTKLISDISNTMVKPAERILGGAANMDPGMIRSGFSMYSNLVRAAFDVFNFTDIASKMNELAGGSTIGITARKLMNESELFESHGQPPYGAISSANLGLKDGNFATGVNWLGSAIRIPQRVLGTMDTFFKQLNYRAYLYTAADSLAQKKGLVGDEYGQFISDWLTKQFGEGGAFTNKNALNYAKDSTFGKDLLPGTIGNSLQNMVGNHPGLKLIFPFVQTPTNIFRRFVQYTPGINMLQQEFREALGSANPTIAAEAKGRMAFGGLLWTGAIGLASSGKLTGGGPGNPQEKNALLDTGWRPYSIVLDGPDGKKQYVDYRKLEPYAYILGLSADFHDAAAQMHDEDQQGLAQAMTFAMAKNITSKSYLTGLTELVNALAQPDQNVQRFLNNRAGSYVPALFAKENPDDYMHQVRSIMDAVMRRMPGFSQDLPPVRDLFGQPVRTPGGYLPFGMSGDAARTVSPVAFSKQIDDPVRNELAKLQFGFSKAPKTYQGFPLSSFTKNGQDASDRFQELHGQVEVGGQKMGEALSNLINSDRYKGLPSPEGHGDQTNPRVMAVEKVISQYREKAMQQTVQEYPAIRRAIQSYQQQARLERVGQ